MASKFFLLALFDVAFFIFSKFCPSAEDTRRTRARREASVLMPVLCLFWREQHSRLRKCHHCCHFSQDTLALFLFRCYHRWNLDDNLVYPKLIASRNEIAITEAANFACTELRREHVSVLVAAMERTVDVLIVGFLVTPLTYLLYIPEPRMVIPWRQSGHNCCFLNRPQSCDQRGSSLVWRAMYSACAPFRAVGVGRC